MYTTKGLRRRFQSLQCPYYRSFSNALRIALDKGMARLNPKRRLIEIYGLDAGKFLKNMISNNIPPEGPDSGVFSGFFLPQVWLL